MNRLHLAQIVWLSVAVSIAFLPSCAKPVQTTEPMNYYEPAHPHPGVEGVYRWKVTIEYFSGEPTVVQCNHAWGFDSAGNTYIKLDGVMYPLYAIRSVRRVEQRATGE